MRVADDLSLTNHARERMTTRGINSAKIDLVMVYGRVVFVRGAIIHALGRREIDSCRAQDGLDLSKCEGVHVVCSKDGDILTVYRNKNLSGLRRDGRRQSSQGFGAMGAN